jgi:hypothetical protein
MAFVARQSEPGIRQWMAGPSEMSMPRKGLIGEAITPEEKIPLNPQR